MYRAKIVADSVGPTNPDSLRLTTVEIEFPRIVLAEVATHRLVRGSGDDYEEVSWSDRTTTDDMSKNSASSRAIPFKRMLQKVIDDPYIPERFSKNGPGMQGHGWLEGDSDEAVRWGWLQARNRMVEYARMMNASGVHKQDVNRLLEPFSWVTQVLTADQYGWANFFAQRCHKDAAPAFQKVARMLYLEYRKSIPRQLEKGQWHLPFVPVEDQSGFVFYPPYASVEFGGSVELPDLIQLSVARCAWVSYSLHEKEATMDDAKKTFTKLVGGAPIHGSPTEHQATPMPWGLQKTGVCQSNLRGWCQARKLIQNERINEYQPSEEEIQTWGL